MSYGPKVVWRMAMKPIFRKLAFSTVLLGLTTIGWSQQDQQNTPPSAQQSDTQQTNAQQPAAQSTTTSTPQTAEPTKDEKPTKRAKFDDKAKGSEPDVVKRLDSSANVLDEIMGTPDKGIPKKILSDAKCIIVVP